MEFLISTVAVYCALFFFIEAFTFYNWTLMLMRILASTLLTFIILLAFDSLTAKSR